MTVQGVCRKICSVAVDMSANPNDVSNLLADCGFVSAANIEPVNTTWSLVNTTNRHKLNTAVITRFAFAEDVRRTRRVPKLLNRTACPREVHVPVAIFVPSHTILETLPRVRVFDTL